MVMALPFAKKASLEIVNKLRSWFHPEPNRVVLTNCNKGVSIYCIYYRYVYIYMVYIYMYRLRLSARKKCHTNPKGNNIPVPNSLNKTAKPQPRTSIPRICNKKRLVSVSSTLQGFSAKPHGETTVKRLFFWSSQIFSMLLTYWILSHNWGVIQASDVWFLWVFTNGLGRCLYKGTKPYENSYNPIFHDVF